jgi:DNA-binding response OmpR family regulator
VARILIAEDDPLVSSFIEKGLRANGYTTQVAEDGEDATELGLSGDFDLLLLDMALPKREGVEVLEQLRTRGCHIPVIVLTGRPEMRERVSTLRVGADDFMTKPFRFDELLARVRAQLRFRRLQDDLDVDPTEREEEGPHPAVALPRETGWRGS